VKDALRFVIEDAVEIFVAGATRLGVLDNHVMVGELLATGQIKAVENTGQPFAREFGADVGARELRAERKGMDAHVARAAKLRGNRCQMKRGVGFVLKFHVLQHGVVAGDDFGDGIGEVRHIVRRKVTFDDRCPAVGPGNNQVARLDGFAVLFGVEMKMNWMGSATETPAGT